MNFFIGFLSCQSFYFSQGGKVSIWERGKRLGWGVESKWGDPVPQWRSYEKVTGEETQFDAWMQHLGWQIWHSWIPRSHHNILDRRKLFMLELPRLPWMKIKVKSLILIFPESSFTSTHYSALMTTVRLQIVECKDGLINILCPGNLFTWLNVCLPRKQRVLPLMGCFLRTQSYQ